jgi:hypothetical protein
MVQLIHGLLQAQSKVLLAEDNIFPAEETPLQMDKEVLDGVEGRSLGRKVDPLQSQLTDQRLNNEIA